MSSSSSSSSLSSSPEPRPQTPRHRPPEPGAAPDRVVAHANRASVLQLADEVAADGQLVRSRLLRGSHKFRVEVARAPYSKQDKRRIFAIFKQNMSASYKVSSFGWTPGAKKQELFHDDSRFILLRHWDEPVKVEEAAEKADQEGAEVQGRAPQTVGEVKREQAAPEVGPSASAGPSSSFIAPTAPSPGASGSELLSTPALSKPIAPSSPFGLVEQCAPFSSSQPNDLPPPSSVPPLPSPSHVLLPSSTIPSPPPQPIPRVLPASSASTSSSALAAPSSGAPFSLPLKYPFSLLSRTPPPPSSAPATTSPLTVPAAAAAATAEPVVAGPNGRKRRKAPPAGTERRRSSRLALPEPAGASAGCAGPPTAAAGRTGLVGNNSSGRGAGGWPAPLEASATASLPESLALSTPAGNAGLEHPPAGPLSHVPLLPTTATRAPAASGASRRTSSRLSTAPTVSYREARPWRAIRPEPSSSSSSLADQQPLPQPIPLPAAPLQLGPDGLPKRRPGRPSKASIEQRALALAARELALETDARAKEETRKAEEERRKREEEEGERHPVEGYAMWRFDTEVNEEGELEPIVYLYELSIASDFQRLGLGRYLVTRLEDVGRAWGCKRVMLTVLKSNVRALSFYRKMGYEIDHSSPSRFTWDSDSSDGEDSAVLPPPSLPSEPVPPPPPPPPRKADGEGEGEVTGLLWIGGTWRRVKYDYEIMSKALGPADAAAGGAASVKEAGLRLLGQGALAQSSDARPADINITTLVAAAAATPRPASSKCATRSSQAVRPSQTPLVPPLGASATNGGITGTPIASVTAAAAAALSNRRDRSAGSPSGIATPRAGRPPSSYTTRTTAAVAPAPFNAGTNTKKEHAEVECQPVLASASSSSDTLGASVPPTNAPPDTGNEKKRKRAPAAVGGEAVGGGLPVGLQGVATAQGAQVRSPREGTRKGLRARV